MFDYSAGGLIQINDLEKSTLLVVPQKNEKPVPFPSSVLNRMSARWREDKGPIGLAIRENKFDLLRSAINTVKKRG